MRVVEAAPRSQRILSPPHGSWRLSRSINLYDVRGGAADRERCVDWKAQVAQAAWITGAEVIERELYNNLFES
jgi:hypothetical protein